MTAVAILRTASVGRPLRDLSPPHRRNSNAVCCAVQRICQEHRADPASVSCCATDATVAQGWCQASSSLSHPAYASLCRAWSATYATGTAAVVDGAVRDADPADWRTLPPAGGSGAFCDVLGERQRAWLARGLGASNARLNIVVAPGGLLGNPAAEGSGGCSGTEWDCYRPAQVNLLHTLANTTACTIILSGAASSAMCMRVTGGATGTARYRRWSCTWKGSVVRLQQPGRICSNHPTCGRSTQHTACCGRVMCSPNRFQRPPTQQLKLHFVLFGLRCDGHQIDEGSAKPGQCRRWPPRKSTPRACTCKLCQNMER